MGGGIMKNNRAAFVCLLGVCFLFSLVFDSIDIYGKQWELSSPDY